MCNSCNQEKKQEKTCYSFSGKKVCEVCGCHTENCSCEFIEEDE